MLTSEEAFSAAKLLARAAQELYSTGIWKFDALIADIKCPNEVGARPFGGCALEANMTPALARIRRFGLNGQPLDNSLLWARRMDTAFGVEDLHRLLANASKSYDSRWGAPRP